MKYVIVLCNRFKTFKKPDEILPWILNISTQTESLRLLSSVSECQKENHRLDLGVRHLEKIYRGSQVHDSVS
jgi:hypothetical protein